MEEAAEGDMNKSLFASSQWYAFATVALWSSAFVFTKVALQSFSSTGLGFLRLETLSLVDGII